MLTSLPGPLCLHAPNSRLGPLSSDYAIRSAFLLSCLLVCCLRPPIGRSLPGRFRHVALCRPVLPCKTASALAFELRVLVLPGPQVLLSHTGHRNFTNVAQLPGSAFKLVPAPASVTVGVADVAVVAAVALAGAKAEVVET